ncbi:hypothetical protein JCM33374_g6172 [Metschnikowia sp. JCM 33374]|nr:hypothetical protein JCM33374_g6172 [Metschnikowia sp. JCM 33374]
MNGPVFFQDLLDNLHSLHVYTGTDVVSFHQLLVRAWSAVCELLGARGPPVSLEVSCSVLPKLTLYVHTYGHLPGTPGAPGAPAGAQNDDFTYSKILSFIQNGPQENSYEGRGGYGDRIAQIRKVVLEKYALERRSGPTRQTHAAVISELSDLVSFVSRSQTAAETELFEYISNCFWYEVGSFETGVREHRPSAFDAGDANTEKLISALDKYTHTLAGSGRFPASQTPVLGTGGSGSSEGGPAQGPVNFSTSDPNLAKLYHIFIQLALHKSPPQSLEDVTPYVNVMVTFYKKYAQIDTFDINDQTQKSVRILDLFCGSQTSPGILPAHLREQALEILTSDPENDAISSPFSDENETSLPPPPISQGFSKTEILALVADFETIISMLNDYDSTLDASLSSAFRNYIFFSYELFPEAPVAEDFLFIDLVVETITAVVDYVATDEYGENDIISDILLSIREIQDKLLEVSDSSTLLMRLTVSETVNSLSFARTCLRRWNRKTLIAKQLRLIQEEEYTPRLETKLLRNVFQKWNTKTWSVSQLSAEADAYCSKKQLSYHFNKRWIKSLIHIIEMNTRVDGLKLKQFFTIWRKKLAKQRDMESSSDSYFEYICMVSSLRHWRQKLEKVQSLESTGDRFINDTKEGSNQLLTTKVWQHWKSKLDESVFDHQTETFTLSQKLSTLNEISRNFLLRKYFGVLMARSANHKSLVSFQKTRSSFLKNHFLNTWKMKKELSNMRETVAQKRILSLKRSVLDCWYDQMRSRISADQKLRHTSLQKYWKQWRTKKTEINYHQVRASEIERKFFKTWLLRYKGSSIIRQTDLRSARVVLSSWLEKAAQILENEEVAESSNKRFVAYDAMVLWRSRMDTINESKIVADLNFQRKFLSRIWRLYSQIQKQNMKADEVLAKGPSLLNKFQLKVTLKKWQDVYLLRYEKEASQALGFFQVKVRNFGTLSVMLRHWRSKYHKIKKKSELLEQNLTFFNNTNSLKSETLMLWIDSSRANAKALEESAEFYRTLLHKKFLLIWYEKYTTKSRYLSEISEDLVNKREYNHMVEILRKWNLAFIKNVTRNQTTCDMFVEKWQKIHLKSLFELWLFKARKKLTAVDEYEEANTTFGSNTSPLSRKFIGSGASLEHLDGASYLHTPVKKQVFRSPFTPAKSSTSPTRLQETNQKMKSTKMDAMTNRYKLAKGEISNGRPRMTPSNSTTLPPPEPSFSPPRLPMKPPPAPKFEKFTNRKFVPDATSSPEDLGFKRHERPKNEPEDVVLETAKRLQMIKPVIIPQDRSTTEFRVSPIKKLRERLQSRAELIKSPSSEVFDK